MMKRTIGVILLGLSLALAGCGAQGQQETPEAETPAEEVTQEEEAKALVVYFSRTGEQYNVGTIEKGNTAIVAEMIAEETAADMFEILPVEDYPYTYDELLSVSQKEREENARPAYQEGLPDLAQYDTIFIGSPVWWGDYPMIMYNFIESEDLDGKRLVPFSTHGGSGLAGFDGKLAAACPDAEILTGLAIPGTDAQNDAEGVRSKVQEWLNGLDV